MSNVDFMFSFVPSSVLFQFWFISYMYFQPLTNLAVVCYKSTPSMTLIAQWTAALNPISFGRGGGDYLGKYLHYLHRKMYCALMAEPADYLHVDRV